MTIDSSLQELKEYMDVHFATMKAEITAIRKDMATKTDIQRLERRILESRQISTKHHLASREDIGHLNRQFTQLREGLAKAADTAL